MKTNIIKLFEEFSDNENKEIDLDIQDIFIDLYDKDDGWVINILTSMNLIKYVYIEKIQYFSGRERIQFFNLVDIEYEINKLIQYMTDLGFDYSSKCIGRHNSEYHLVIKTGDYIRKIEGPNEWRFDDEVKQLKFTFKK